MESLESRRFATGELIVVRGVMDEQFVDGGICDVKPAYVVEDSEERIVLWTPLGTPTMVCRPRDPALPRPWFADDVRFVPDTYRWRHTLAICLPGERRSTWATWSRDWEFLGWYVNLQSLLCRTARGFDVRDHQLDVLIDPDRSWRWKDEADLERAVEVGQFTAAAAAAIRNAGESAIDALGRNASPFREPWERWRPPPAWTMPAAVPDWRF